MTLRIMGAKNNQDQKQNFSEILVQNARENKHEYNLNADAPVFDILHPKLIEAKLFFEAGDEIITPTFLLPDRFLYSFSDIQSAKNAAPNAVEVDGRPWKVGELLGQGFDGDFIIDLYPLGAAFISRSLKNIEITKDLHQHLVPIWLNYALSPELWGPQGKWTRFHNRLHLLFEKHNLLNGKDTPGFYPLKLEAKKIEKSGFKGTFKEDSYTLTLPWTFPLSALERLEKVIAEEF